jgi:type II secretory pathway component GspD/PulD (secretin)
MSKKLFPQLLVLVAIIALFVSGITGSAQGQVSSDPSQTNIGKIEFESTDAREALRTLFKMVGVSYAIQPEVQGTITVALRNVTFEVALQNVLRQVDATYRVEAGVYSIFRKSDFGIVPDVILSDNSPTDSFKSETAITQDTHFLYIVRGNFVYKLQKADLKVVKIGSLPQPGGPVVGAGGFRPK